MFAYGPADAAASPNPIILKSRLVLPFWYWLTQVVLEKSCEMGVVVIVVKDGVAKSQMRYRQ